MKETLQIPTPETLENLIGKELYNVWSSLCQLIEQKYNMDNCGIMAEKPGSTNINIAEVGKRFAPYMPESRLSVSWSF